MFLSQAQSGFQLASPEQLFESDSDLSDWSARPAAGSTRTQQDSPHML
jgi:hypothetical protein